MILLIIALCLAFAGILFIALAYQRRNPDKSFISFQNPWNPFKMGDWYLSKAGHRFAILSGFLLSLSGLFGVLYWLQR
jgi:hypothetical protein